MSIFDHFNDSYRKLPPEFYTNTSIESFPESSLIFWNSDLAKNYNLPDNAKDDLKRYFQDPSSEHSLQPLSMAYLGHQFGHLNKLGDGRAHLIGEWTTSDQNIFDFHTKGSGKSIYSRGGDGYASVEPMIKEIFFSEFLHALNIPTTRSLAVFKTNQPVYRNQVDPGAILIRTAQSHIRIGTFQWAAHLGQEHVSALVDYTVERLKIQLTHDNKSVSLLYSVIQKLAQLTAQWMAYGFVHGVLNTDNILISGETIDFGPCAFINEFDLKKTFSSIDTQGRYAFGNQPAVMEWNVTRFAETLIPLLHTDEYQALEIAKNALSQFKIIFEKEYFKNLARRIGFQTENEDSKNLLLGLIQILDQTRYDYNQFFLDLMNNTLPATFKKWLDERKAFLQKYPNTDPDYDLMLKWNPQRIPRLKLILKVSQDYIENNNTALFNEFIESLQDPFIIKDKWTPFNSEDLFSDQGLKTFCGT